MRGALKSVWNLRRFHDHTALHASWKFDPARPSRAFNWTTSRAAALESETHLSMLGDHAYLVWIGVKLATLP